MSTITASAYAPLVTALRERHDTLMGASQVYFRAAPAGTTGTYAVLASETEGEEFRLRDRDAAANSFTATVNYWSPTMLAAASAYDTALRSLTADPLSVDGFGLAETRLDLAMNRQDGPMHGVTVRYRFTLNPT